MGKMIVRKREVIKVLSFCKAQNIKALRWYSQELIEDGTFHLLNKRHQAVFTALANDTFKIKEGFKRYYKTK